MQCAKIEIQTDKSFLHTKHQRSQSPVRKRRSRRQFSQRQQIEIDYIPGREKTRPKSGSKKQAEQFEEGEVTILQVDDELPQEAETRAAAEAGSDGNRKITNLIILWILVRLPRLPNIPLCLTMTPLGTKMIMIIVLTTMMMNFPR